MYKVIQKSSYRGLLNIHFGRILKTANLVNMIIIHMFFMARMPTSVERLLHCVFAIIYYGLLMTFLYIVILSNLKILDEFVVIE